MEYEGKYLEKYLNTLQKYLNTVIKYKLKNVFKYCPALLITYNTEVSNDTSDKELHHRIFLNAQLMVEKIVTAFY